LSSRLFFRSCSQKFRHVANVSPAWYRMSSLNRNPIIVCTSTIRITQSVFIGRLPSKGRMTSLLRKDGRYRPSQTWGFQSSSSVFFCFFWKQEFLHFSTHYFCPIFPHNLMPSEYSRLHVFILSGSAAAIVALRRLHVTTCQWTWRSYRRQGIPRLDEPISASQECLLQQTALCLHRAIAVLVCQPLVRTTCLHTVGSSFRVSTLSWHNKPVWSAAWSVERCSLYRRVRELHSWYLHLQGFIVHCGVCTFHATETSLQLLCS
jgi:hypothetical protein